MHSLTFISELRGSFDNNLGKLFAQTIWSAREISQAKYLKQCKLAQGL